MATSKKTAKKAKRKAPAKNTKPASKRPRRLSSAKSKEVNDFIKKHAPKTSNWRAVKELLRTQLGVELTWNAVERRGERMGVTTMHVAKHNKYAPKDPTKLHPDDPTAARVLEVIRKRKTLQTVEDLANTLVTSPALIRRAIDDLRDGGYNVVTASGLIDLSREIPKSDPFRIDARKLKGKVYRFGLTADNHMCFPPQTTVETESGPKRICQIKPGIKVLTARGRYRAVTEVVKSSHDGTFVRIRFKGPSTGGSNAYASLMCTPNHPVLVVRDGVEGYLPASEIQKGDAVRGLSKKCSRCDARVPLWMKVCKDCDPYVRPVSDAKRQQRYKQHLRAGKHEHWSRHYSWLEPNSAGFVGFVVSTVETVKTRPTQVYNLIVDRDESYVAKRCVVHNCSKYERMDVLESLFDIWHAQGIQHVYQLGNMIDGDARFNKFDVICQGLEAQSRYAAAHWPKRKGMKTYFITGDDHEGWYVQREGVEVGRYMEAVARDMGRQDMSYLGHMEKDIVFTGRRQRSIMRLIHAGGGTGYATSYAAQKIVECVPTDTDILTPSGWKRHDEISVGSVVLGYNGETDKCEWTTVQAVHKGRGDVVRYHNDQFDVRCTSNHRWAVEWESRAGPNPDSAKPECYSRKEHRLWSLDECKERSRIIQAAAAPDGPGLGDFQHEDWLQRNGEAAKRVLQMTSGERRAYIEGLMLGEGTIGGSKDNRTLIFSQRPGCVNDAFRLACFLEGIATTDRPASPGSFKPDQSPARRVTMLRKRLRNAASLDAEPLGEQDVWCVTTALGTWAMRQGSTITITGNSYQGGEKPSVLLIGHYHKAEYGYPREVHVVQAGCTCDQTPFMRKNKLQAHVGGWTIEMTVSEDGVITRFRQEWMPFFDKGFYKNAWQYADLNTTGRGKPPQKRQQSWPQISIAA